MLAREILLEPWDATTGGLRKQKDLTSKVVMIKLWGQTGAIVIKLLGMLLMVVVVVSLEGEVVAVLVFVMLTSPDK